MSSSAGSLPGDPPGGRRALAVWGVGVSVYFVAVIFRTSLGVAGLDAADRFQVGASALSTFSILQLLVYAGMQIPVGLLVDRLGTKKVLTLGVLLFTAGQIGFALSSSYGTALASRALLGCGDAMTFISVLRLGSRWFPARRGPMIAQMAGLAGMAGNLVSTLLLARLLHGVGWTAAFAGSSVAGLVVLVLTLLFLKDHPEGHEPEPFPHHGAAYVRRQIATSWREPGTRLGMWVHFTTQFPAMVFLLLWGMPFLVRAQGLSRGTAGELLTLVVLSNMVVGLVYGQIVARHHTARLPLALGTVLATATVWAATILYPGGHAPMWLLVVLCAVLGACGPASMLGFDFARPANPPERQGTASGITNMGGFVASMTTLFAVGALLDLTGDDYRVAFSAVFVLQALGLAQILRLRGRAARRERERLVASRVETVHVPV
ncbi:MFS transporter [Streptomyces sp. LBUM 1478]|nr:MFS transporter [Streptomyces sp. LBUM 1484]MBP5868510.1 MFS transporter [Streptomyces sp. LBUM 1485]MBP5877047.1 MFS transporter [Streptomyces sp. LBUM 1477]MBP5884830.1 MFS transporter [Streptomyces sp. LBUM 1487]MBP5892385.1 MFS transporter [Streptomyces sp. LBUM 1481]MBP5900795.1 MFS transporter [Streptomyces sp. LBUM 1488]MBP5907073.1 MFS transporter [Streptomyces sp. LBUM 1478]MBP5915565.1 MFS transporter [Streptomyces sp. LBUM 1486]MBP5922618.1 MFS transporter [Streptomyces sp. LB